MHQPTTPWMKELLADHGAPCVSIYLPVHRANPQAAENPRRFRDLIERARNEIERGYPKATAEQVVNRITSMIPDEAFWVGDRDAIAFFASPDYAQAIDLQRPVDPSVHVADSFHIKPLIRVLQSAGRYHVLALTQHRVDLYEGTEFTLTRLDPRHIPQDPDVVSKMRMSHDVDSVTDVAIASANTPNEGSAPAASSLDLFMRAVDKAVWEEFSRREQTPLILAAVEHYHSLFHTISKNPYLQEQGIRHDPKGLDAERLRKEAWPVIEPQFRGQVEHIKDQFRAAKAHDRGSDEVPVVAQAAAEGRVGTLLVDQDVQVPGRVHPFSGMIEQAGPNDPHADDILDDVAELVLKRDGEVLVLPHDQMPSDQGIAAIYRY